MVLYTSPPLYPFHPVTTVDPMAFLFTRFLQDDHYEVGPQSDLHYCSKSQDIRLYEESQETTVYTKSSFPFQDDDTLVSFEGLLQLYKGSKTFWSYVGKASGMFIHATIKPNKQGWFPISSASAHHSPISLSQSSYGLHTHTHTHTYTPPAVSLLINYLLN